jgi:hypothetical protein
MGHQLKPNKTHLLNILALFTPCHPHDTNLKNKVNRSIRQNNEKQFPNDGYQIWHWIKNIPTTSHCDSQKRLRQVYQTAIDTEQKCGVV